MSYSHTELTSAIIEAAMEVQRALGGGFSKDVIKRALAAELAREGFDAQVDTGVPLFYKGDEVGERHLDLSVESAISVELNTEAHYHVPDLERAMRQLRATGMETGLLLNFGPTKLDYVRLHLQGSRSDILIGDSIPHAPERHAPFGMNGHSSNGKSGRGHVDRSGRRRWIPPWLRGKGA